MGRVLVVDDERSMREFLAICLRRQGHQVSVAENGDQAVLALDETEVDIVVTDLQMPGDTDGLGVLAAVKERDLETEVIVVTAFATPKTAISAMKDGAYDYLTKPFKIDEINAVIARALEKRALVAANTMLRAAVSGRHRLASLIARSPQMQRVFDLIEKIHSTKTNVLITGESGTGKELVARALHSEGNRSSKPFVAVNCGAIPADLLESELFGHVKGSFTGAVTDKVGLFEQADGGSLLLDEIGELSMGLQVKLLRALQERQIKPVGASVEKTIDVRVIAATNRELEEEVERGAFRQDLFYRLNVIELRIPSLRQRDGDIALLVDHFIRRFAAEQDKDVRGISPEALVKLEAYHYPGNVRELENIIERAVTLCSGSTLAEDDLPRLREPNKTGTTVAEMTDIPATGIDLDVALANFERTIIGRALEMSGGVRKKAAGLLGITFRSFRYRLKKLGLENDIDDDG